MKRLTPEEIAKINEINGTLANRYEYFSKIAVVLNGNYTTVRWNRKFVEAVQLDKTTVCDVRCRTVKGKMMIKYLEIRDFKKTEENPYGQFEFYELKKGVLVKTLGI